MKELLDELLDEEPFDEDPPEELPPEEDFLLLVVLL